MSHRILLIHGFNDRSAGAKNIDLMKPYLESLGYKVDTDSADYGWIGLIGVRLRKHKAVMRIVNAMEDENTRMVMTYSNGANYAMKALKLLWRNDMVVFHCSPALIKRATFPSSVHKAHVFFTKSDWAVKFSTLARWLRLTPGWGNMGSEGYVGEDPRIENHDYTDIAKHHGGMFHTDAVRRYLAKHVDKLMKEATS